MMRDIIEIDESLCNGCGNCVPGCQEGALQIIDGKARLISDLMCDGLGACLGHCPTGAMRVIKREAEPYDERRVMLENIIPAGPNTIRAHLDHLIEHGEEGYHAAAIAVLKEQGIKAPASQSKSPCSSGGCPGSMMKELSPQPPHGMPSGAAGQPEPAGRSQLRQWPVQLHLVSPQAPYFKGADVLLAADCTAYAAGNFHSDFLKGKSLAVACPKLDQKQEVYAEKLITMIDQAEINTLTVLIMEVPCCGGLLAMAQEAAAKSSRSIPVKLQMLSLEGKVIQEKWVACG